MPRSESTSLKKALEQSERNFANLFESSFHPRLIVSGSGLQLAAMNHAAQKLFGNRREMPLATLFCNPEDAEYIAHELKVSQAVEAFEAKIRPTDITERMCLISMRPVSYEDKESYVVELFDLTEFRLVEAALQEMNRKLDQAARSDPLTGLANRRAMMEWLEREAVRSQRNKRNFSVTLCDIDFFKKFNDTWGHDCGDFVLQEIAESLKNSLRAQDIVARWGGEEFLMLLPETTLNGAVVLAEKIRRTIEHSIFPFQGMDLTVTMSFGVAEYERSRTIDECIKQADEALYKAKEKGRNCVVRHNPPA